MDLLVVNNLTKIFNQKTMWFAPAKVVCDHVAIQHVSFSLKEGEIVGLTGANGAGKSTLLHMLIGILSPTSGTITYFGKNFAQKRSEVLEQVAFSSSNFKLIPSLTILQNLRFFAQIYNMQEAMSNSKIDDLIFYFGLTEYKHKKIANLSAGESNKVALLKAFLPDAKIVLLDEPTAFLDNKTAALLRCLIQKRRAEYKTTFLLTSHNQQDIAELCDRLIVMKHGKLQDV